MCLDMAKCLQSRKDSDLTLTEVAVSVPVQSDNASSLSWDRPDDPENPRNWTTTRKWLITLIVAMFTFISPVTSSMIAPALDSVGKDLGITSSFEKSLVLSIFVLAYCVGPLFLGPMSEVFGRQMVLQLAYLFFFAFDLACGFSQSRQQLLVFRFISGLGGSAPLAVGPGVLVDLWPPEQRGKALGYYAVGPLLGPAVGPIFGGFIAEYATWRWVFWSIAAYTGFMQIVGIFVLKETYTPVILARRKARRQGCEKRSTTSNTTAALSSKLRIALRRPMMLLFTQPILQALALYQLYIYGVMYLVLTTFPIVWTGIYGESAGIGGINYVSLGLGFLVASIIASPFNDKIYVHLKATRGGGQGRPEFRVPLMVPSSCLVVVGLFTYGWTAFFKTHWIFPNIGIFLFAGGSITAYQCVQTYCVDTYAIVAASAMSAVVMLRSLAGFGFPLFAPAMYDKMGLGWGNSLLGFIALAVGIPAPLGLWCFGEKLRRRSNAAGNE